MSEGTATAGNEADLIAELRRRRAAGEITTDEFKRAKQYLRDELEQGGGNAGQKPSRKSTGLTFMLAAVVGIMLLHWYSPKSSPDETTASAPATALTGKVVVGSFYGEDWPYPPYETGIISCKMTHFGEDGGYQVERPVVTISLGGKDYGLNGAALDLGYPDPKRFVPKGAYGIYKGRIPTVIGEFIQNGLDRCQ